MSAPAPAGPSRRRLRGSAKQHPSPPTSAAPSPLPPPIHYDPCPSRSRRRAIVPSAAVLAVLAPLTASVASAAPPDFLCPRLAAAPERRTRKRLHPRDIETEIRFEPDRSAQRSREQSTHRPRKFPYKYEQGNDGVWTPAASWSLHGQSNDPSPILPRPEDDGDSDSDDAPYPAPSPVEADVSGQTQIPSTVSSSTMPADFVASLPTGWSPLPHRTTLYSTALIVVCSVILALIIAVCIAGAFLKRKHAKKGPPDEEKVLVGKGGALPPAERRRRRRWERWREGVIRRRRGRRSKLVVGASDVEEEDERAEDADSATLSSARPSLPRPTTPPPPPTPEPEPSASTPAPPAYLSASPRRRSRSAPHAKSSSPSPPPSRPHSPCLSPPPPPTPPPPHSPAFTGHAHVATDEKAVLERLRAGASAPHVPESEPGVAAGHAPSWDDLHDFDLQEGPSSPPLVPSSSLPLPPTAQPRATHDPDAYFVPAFDALDGPSAPPDMDDAVLAPSAPAPEEDESDVDVGSPSAPPLEPESDEEDAGNGDEDRASSSRRTMPSTGYLPRYEP